MVDREDNKLGLTMLLIGIGLVLLLLGFLTGIYILWILGIVALVVGLILLIVGHVGAASTRRGHYWW